MTTNILLLLVLIVGVYFILQRRRKESDFTALFYSRAAQPFYVFPSDPTDETVRDRAEKIRQLLIKHGNLKLNPATDVIEYEYFAMKDNISVDFFAFIQLAIKDAADHSERFRIEKLGYTPDAKKEFVLYGAAN